MLLTSGLVFSQGSYIALDGTGDYVDTGDGASPQNFNRGYDPAWTLEIWFRIEDVDNPTGTNSTIVAHRGSTASDANTIIYVATDGSIRSFLGGSVTSLAPA